MRVSAIVEARLNSKRLPGKHLLPVGGKPLIEKLVERLRLCQLIDTIILATPDTREQRPLCDWAKTQPDVKVFTGSEDDVLMRVLGAARATRTDVVVEVTGDEPLIDPNIVDLVTGYCICGHDVSVNVGPNEEHSWPKGMDVRAFKTCILEDAEPKTRSNFFWRNNVSPYLYRKDTEYDVRYLEAPEGEICPALNLSVDDEADYKRVKDIYETIEPLNPAFTIREILSYLATLPTYYELVNAPKLFKPANWLSVNG